MTEADAATYGGLGLRLGRRRRALVLTPGPGVEFTDLAGRTTFVRSTRPAAVLETFREARRP